MDNFALRVATPGDALAIADLANQYTYQQLDDAARQGGFLTGTFSGPALQAMLASVPGQVAHQHGELAGFVVNSRLAPASYPPLVREICALLPTLFYQERALADYQWFFYGPVLVATKYRGRGLLRQLFVATKLALAGRFDLGIAFIAEENTASLRVHTQKLGLAVVGKLAFGGTSYAILAFAVG
jgi:predicted GNAT superfamily acetyltransferase